MGGDLPVSDVNDAPFVRPSATPDPLGDDQIVLDPTFQLALPTSLATREAQLEHTAKCGPPTGIDVQVECHAIRAVECQLARLDAVGECTSSDVQAGAILFLRAGVDAYGRRDRVDVL